MTRYDPYISKKHQFANSFSKLLGQHPRNITLCCDPGAPKDSCPWALRTSATPLICTYYTCYKLSCYILILSEATQCTNKWFHFSLDLRQLVRALHDHADNRLYRNLQTLAREWEERSGGRKIVNFINGSVGLVLCWSLRDDINLAISRKILQFQRLSGTIFTVFPHIS